MKIELDHDAARGQAMPVDPPPHPPEEDDRDRARSVAGSPNAQRSPPAEDVDDPLKLAGAGWSVLHGSALLAGVPLDDPHPFKPRGRSTMQRTRMPEGPVEVVEVAETREQLSRRSAESSGQRESLTPEQRGRTEPYRYMAAPPPEGAGISPGSLIVLAFPRQAPPGSR